MKDPYTYNDGITLRNKHDIKDFEELSSLEETIINASKFDLPKGEFDYKHLKAIHRHLFTDLYDWAGQERSVTTSKNGIPYAAPHLIEKEAQKLFAKLKQENFLQGLNKEDFCQKVSEYFNEINAIHPFREGNSRTNGAFFDLLAERAGYTIAWEKFSTLEYTKAKIAGHCGLDYKPLYDLIYANTYETDSKKLKQGNATDEFGVTIPAVSDKTRDAIAAYAQQYYEHREKFNRFHGEDSAWVQKLSYDCKQLHKKAIEALAEYRTKHTADIFKLSDKNIQDLIAKKNNIYALATMATLINVRAKHYEESCEQASTNQAQSKAKTQKLF